ncbi:PorV/PorQ family protein [Lutibacter sp. A80]|uniref:putative type IX sorting system protein PorV2 n=1 Tax=Lutibacter sp. A80 TaxID=2918453 RepID=UPI001F06008C|nr:PorV/PorQ family protein [Lutibacter sp. A80]UMB60912.1 PorV/PorQ family protein [Lutibacter sp. A80]
MKKYLLLFLFSTQLIMAQSVRKYSNEFLNIGVDAAAFGMSKAVVATSNDVNSSYWNPAGLVAVKNYEGSIMHAEYFEGIAKYDYAAFAMPIDDKSAVGISIIRFGVDDILNTTELIDSEGNIDYNKISLFSAADYALNLSYARNLNIEGLNVGLNTKIIRRIIGDFATSWGFGLDAALQYKKNDWKYGVMLRDITTTYNSWNIDEKEFEKIQNAIPDQNQELPETTEITLPKAQIGVARKFNISKYFNLLSELDLNLRFTKTNDIISSDAISIDPALGFQLDYTDLVYLRAGIGNIQKELQFDESTETSVQPNFGVGFKYKGIQIDYALTNIGSVGAALYSNVFSIKVDFENFR